MASKLFDYDNPFFMFMSRIWDLMILNFLAVLLCLPVITAGASVTALYYITLKMAEDRESHIYRSFLKAFRDNLVQSTAIHLIVTAAGAVLLLYLRVFGGAGQFEAQGINLIFFLPIAALSIVLHARNGLVSWKAAGICILAGLPAVAGLRATAF